QRSASAITYSGNLKLFGSVTLRARLLKGNIFTGGDWSPLSEARFTVGTTRPVRASLVLTKVHYHPLSPNEEEKAAGFDSAADFEYLELYNPSDSNIHLSGVTFSSGISHTFAQGEELGAGQRGLLVRNAAAFRLRFGDSPFLLGEFEGKLSNGGETIALTDAFGDTLFEFTYDDKAPWTEEADGRGASLALRIPETPADGNEAANWAAALNEGDPGAEPTLANDGDSDPLREWMDAQGLVTLRPEDLLVFALGQDLAPGLDGAAVSLTHSGTSLRYRRRTHAGSVRFEIERSTDLKAWQPSQAPILQQSDDPSGITTVEVAAENAPGLQYFRLVIRTPGP
ncbi:MAG: lamin tail domain-containing protein, partial [Verrucomicrobiota bacterium]